MISAITYAMGTYRKCLFSCLCPYANQNETTQYDPFEQPLKCRVRNRYKWLLLVTVLGIWKPAFADPDSFYNRGIVAFSAADVAADCSACHNKVLNTGLTMGPTDTLPSDSNLATFTLEGIGQTSFSWFYQVDGLTVSRLFQHTADPAMFTIDVEGATESSSNEISLKYCIGEGVQGEIGRFNTEGSSGIDKDFNCSTAVIERMSPNLDPSFIPGNEIEDITVNVNADDIEINVTAVDPNPGDEITYISSQNEPGVINVSGGGPSGSFTIDPIAQGDRIVTITASDQQGGNVSQIFMVTVEGLPIDEIPTNTPPTFTSAPIADFTLDENGVGRPITVVATDVDTDSLTYSSMVAGNSVTVTGGGDDGRFDVTPNALGDSIVTLSVTDGNTLPVETSFMVTVIEKENQPDPVEINSLSVESPLTIDLGDSVPIMVMVSGGSGALTFTTAVSENDLDDIGISPTANNDGNFSLTGEAETDGAQVTFSVSDGEGSTDSVTLQVVVIDDEDEEGGNGSPDGMALYSSLNCSTCHNEGVVGAPLISDTERWQELVNLRTQQGFLESVITGRGAMTPYPLPAPDYNEADLRAAVEFVSGGVVADQDLDGIPDTADNCRDDVNPGQEDGDNDGIGNECDTTDGAGNNPPVAQPDEHIITAADGSELINVLGNDTDPDEGDRLSIVLDNATSQLGVTLLIEDNQVRYQAPDGFSQTDMFSYRARDSSDEESDSVTVMVSPSDQDDDGVFDNADNCPGVPNSDQNNQDSDDLGDACDATPGGGSASTVLSEEALARAQALVEELCVGCHLNAANPAPQLGDQSDWDNRLAMAGSIEALVDVAINGNELGMPRFGNLRTAEELTEAVIYLGGFATTDTGEVVGPGTDPGIGETNPTADNDADGYIASVDDDDTNAERIPGTAPIGSGNPVFFISDSSMMVGEVGRAVLSANDNQSGGVLISDTDFVQFAEQVYPGVQASVEDRYISALDTIDLQLNLASGSNGELTMELMNPLQLSSVISTYSPQSGAWSDFVTDAGVGELASAPLGQGGCPVVGSLNYIGGLGAGLQCVRVRITDGGMNDADRQVNGQILFIAQLSSIVDDSTGTNPTPVTSGGSSGGGGMTSVWLLLFLGIGKCIRCHRLLTMRRIFQRCLKGFSSA